MVSSKIFRQGGLYYHMFGRHESLSLNHAAGGSLNRPES